MAKSKAKVRAEIKVSETPTPLPKLSDLVVAATGKTPLSAAKAAVKAKFQGVTINETAQNTLKGYLQDPSINPISGTDAEKMVKTAVTDVIRSYLYKLAFEFEGHVKIMGAGPIELKRDPDRSGRIEMGEGKTFTVTNTEIGTHFHLSQDVIDALPTSATVNDFMVDVKTKEFAVGVTLTEPLNFINAAGLSFITNIIDVEDISAFISRTYIGND